jgi:nucleoside triphosphate pyrophosphatase
MTDRPRLVLASSSPRRRELLAMLGLEFVVRAADVDESPRPAESPEAYVARLAEEKARAAGGAGELVLAADTIVVLDGALLGKPADAAEARAMLRRLSGRDHEVFTGVGLWQAVPGEGRWAGTVVRSTVRMAALTDKQIAWYVETGEPLDKAGAYAAQGLGALFVERIDGNFHNVIGLPLPALDGLFSALGHELAQWRRAGS